MSKKHKEPKLYTYRIKYNAGADHAAEDSYHYFTALDAGQALKFHEAMMKRKNFTGQTISVEKKDVYADKWVEEAINFHNIDHE